MLNLLEPISDCPLCMGAAQDYSIKHHKLITCPLCEGRRWIPAYICKGCGRPAFKFWPRNQTPIVRFCGLEDCLTKLVAIHKPAVPKIVEAAAIGRIDPLREERERLEELENRFGGHVMGPASRSRLL